MKLSRRKLLKLGAGAAALWATGIGLRRAAAQASSKKIPIGLQLYSVRKDCEEDLPNVLKAVAEMGYDGVEFAGYYGRSAGQLRELLDANDLRCCGTHTQLSTLSGDALEGTIEFNKTLGNKFLIVPGLPHAKLASVEATHETAKLFSKLAAKANKAGMRVGYHAHGGDFRKIDGTTPWEVLFSHASDDVVMQLDIGNCIGGGGDPIALLRKFPGRSATIHLKEHGGKPGAVIGEGDVDWGEVFRLCETTGRTEWYIVEHESRNKNLTPLQCVGQCVKNLRKMGK